MIATDHDIRRLRQKDHRLTSLFLNFSCKPQPVEGSSQSRGLQGALKDNETVSNVVIFVDDSFASSDMDLDVYDGILNAIGRLSSLKALQVTSPPHARGILPVRVLARLLRATTGLQSLGIYDLNLAGSQNDFDQLAQEAQRLWYLKCFAIQEGDVQLRPSSGASKNYKLSGDPPSPSLDALLLSLCMLPSLQTLTLTRRSHSSQAALPAFSTSAFSGLFMSSSIRTLKVEGWGWSNDYVTSMARILPSNGTLQALTLGALPKMTTDVAKSLACMLQNNQSLIHLDMTLSHMLSDDCALSLAKALQCSGSQGSCSRLQSLVLSGQRLGRTTKTCQVAFQEMMENNYSLRKVVLFRKTFLQPTLQFYTRLNALGRQSLLRLTDTPGVHHPEATWVDALSHPLVQNDLDAMFYFLSSNPALFVQAAGLKETKKRPIVEPDRDTTLSSSQPAIKRQRTLG